MHSAEAHPTFPELASQQTSTELAEIHGPQRIGYCAWLRTPLCKTAPPAATACVPDELGTPLPHLSAQAHAAAEDALVH